MTKLLTSKHIKNDFPLLLYSWSYTFLTVFILMTELVFFLLVPHDFFPHICTMTVLSQNLSGKQQINLFTVINNIILKNY